MFAVVVVSRGRCIAAGGGRALVPSGQWVVSLMVSRCIHRLQVWRVSESSPARLLRSAAVLCFIGRLTGWHL